MESTGSDQANKNTPVPYPSPLLPDKHGGRRMDAVRMLAKQKIQELLVLCGIAHRSDEPIQEHINCIANYGEPAV